MFVVLSRSIDGTLSGMPFSSSQRAMDYARGEAWQKFEGEVDEVEVFRIDDDDPRSAKERVETGEGDLVAQVDLEVDPETAQRIEQRDAGKFLAGLGLGSTSLKPRK